MDKAELRRAVIARRDALDLDLRAAKSAVICARLVELLDRSDAAACGQRMCMRAVAADDASAAPFIAHPTRVFAAVDIDSGRFPIVPAEALDMIVVPLVAFDRAGTRLGYGGGCYDRYLPMLSPACQIIGIAFDEQRVDHVPTNAHDLPLPRIVSA